MSNKVEGAVDGDLDTLAGGLRQSRKRKHARMGSKSSATNRNQFILRKHSTR